MGSLRKSKHDAKNRVIKADNSFFRVSKSKLLNTQEHRFFTYALNKMQSAKENIIKRDTTKPDTELVTADMYDKIRKVEFPLEEFLKIFGIKRKDYINYVDKAVKSVMGYQLAIEKFYINEKGKEKLAGKGYYNVLEHTFYDIKNDIVEIYFSSSTKDLFCNLHNSKYGFTSVNLIETFDMTSCYAVALYEYLKSYLERKDVKKLGELSVKYQELRNILAVPEGEYKLFADFKRKVLEVSKVQINTNKNSMFDVDYMLKKSGRGGKVSEIIFKLSKRKIEPKIIKTESTEQSTDTTHITMTDEEQRAGLDALKKLKKLLKNPTVHPDQISMMNED